MILVEELKKVESNDPTNNDIYCISIISRSYRSRRMHRLKFEVAGSVPSCLDEIKYFSVTVEKEKRRQAKLEEYKTVINMERPAMKRNDCNVEREVYPFSKSACTSKLFAALLLFSKDRLFMYDISIFNARYKFLPIIHINWN